MTIEVMKQGLTAFELELGEGPLLNECHEAMKALRQAIEQTDNFVPIPKDLWQAKAMALISHAWLQSNAPHELPQPVAREQQTADEPVALQCCGYNDPSAVKWNKFNGVVQCHHCGHTYSPQLAAREPVPDG